MTLSDETNRKLKRVKNYFKCSTDQALGLAFDALLINREEKLKVTRKSCGTQGRAIPAKIKKQVMIRARSCCEYPGCDETRNLQFDHQIPYAHGGRHTVKNLKLYCRSHNQRAAIKIFGSELMERYL
jgi:5-methylcytosine-specific restriction endonuclease McrA